MNKITSYFTIFGVFAVLMTSSINTADAELSYDEQVKLVCAIELTMGHILAARENIEIGNYELAQLHLSHSVVELYEKFHERLKYNSQIDSEVELALFILKNTNPNKSGEDFDQEANEILKILDRAKSALVPNSIYTDPDFKLDVVSDLLVMAENEYVMGMDSTNQNLSIAESQDSYAFVVRAENLLDSITSLDENKKNNLSSQLQELKSLISNEESLNVVQKQFDVILEERNMITDDDFDSSILLISGGGILANDSESNLAEKNTKNNVPVGDSSIPSWIKLGSAWWADGLVPDKEFIFGMEYLIQKGFLDV